MQLSFYANTDATHLKQQLRLLEQQTHIRSVVIFAADANGWEPEAINPLVQNYHLPIVGAIFPEIIFQQNHYQQGYVLLALETDLSWALIPELSDPHIDFDLPLEALADQWSQKHGAATHLVLVDGLATRIASLLDAIFDNFGLEQPHLGGGAGSLTFIQKPCLITPKGMAVDAALLVRFPLRASLGVAHGWEPISEPMEVTQAYKNEVQQLNWQSAFDAYRQIVEAHSGQTLDPDNFFELAKSYPLGINRLNAELLVRDPLMVKDGDTLVCVGEVPEGALVRVLTGYPQGLIASAGQAAAQASQQWQDTTTEPELTLVIDCISRVLFMGEQISQELAQTGQARPQFGALTLGEIANAGQDYLAFYNKTIVVGLIGRP